MFSRFRMSPIEEMQGSDWDWAASDSGLRCGAVHVLEGTAISPQKT